MTRKPVPVRARRGLLARWARAQAARDTTTATRVATWADLREFHERQRPIDWKREAELWADEVEEWNPS